jgi:Uma2 family endonuclease
MGMPAVAGEWTAEMVRALPDDGNRYEVVDGELLVTPAPTYRHQAVSRALFRLLTDYLRVQPVAEVMYSPADIELDARTLVQPDLFVYPLREGRKTRDWSDISELLLVIEVLSPSTARYDRHVKRRRYQRQGVPEYWIVDSDARLIERWRAKDDRPEILADEITWRAEDAAESLTVSLPVLFAGVLD